MLDLSKASNVSIEDIVRLERGTKVDDQILDDLWAAFLAASVKSDPPT